MTTQIASTAIAEFKQEIAGVISGTLRPSKIVGTGYRNPKQVASQWLRQQIFKALNPNKPTRQYVVMSTGKPYKTAEKAKSSKAYKQLQNGTFEFISSSYHAESFGVEEAFDGGYVVYIELKVTPMQ